MGSIFYLTCYYKNEDTLTIAKITGNPVISDGSVYIKIVM